MINVNYVGIVVLIIMSVWNFTLCKYIDTIFCLFYAGVLFWVDREHKYADRLYAKIFELQERTKDNLDKLIAEKFQDK